MITRDDFRCRCCKGLLLDDELFDAIVELETLAGVPLHVNSGYRCKQHNAVIGGAALSLHTRGMAADISSSLPLRSLEKLVVSIPAIRGIGFYETKNFIHCDVRHASCYWQG